MSKLEEYSHIAILSAMPEEVGMILDNLNLVKSSKFGDLELFSGKLKTNNNKEIFISTTCSGWGKVSAARATTRLLSINVDNIPIQLALFTGVAGAIDKKLKQWDIVLSDSLIQHDMDARPIFDKYVMPSLNKKYIYTKKLLLKRIYESLSRELKNKNLVGFGSLYKGIIATGDMFISDREKINTLSQEIPGLLAVEMEGAAFAQVAHQEQIDWIVMRVISDGADDDAHEEFNNFLIKYQLKSFDLIRCFLNSLKNI